MPASPLKLQDSLITSIARRIIKGEYSAGQIMTEDDLTRTYNVSRTVVREAIKRLTTLGMVSSRPKVGTIVRPREDWSLMHPDVMRWLVEVEPQTLLRLAEYRLVAEPMLAMLAAENATPDDFAVLRSAFERLERSLRDDRQDSEEADLALNRAILQATHNELLINSAKQLEQALLMLDIQTPSFDSVGDEDSLESILGLKRDILEGILTRDGERAMRAFILLRAGVREQLRQILNQSATPS